MAYMQMQRRQMQPQLQVLTEQTHLASRRPIARQNRGRVGGVPGVAGGGGSLTPVTLADGLTPVTLADGSTAVTLSV